MSDFAIDSQIWSNKNTQIMLVKIVEPHLENVFFFIDSLL